ncbi:acyl-CoA dehydrogenase family protein [Modestobacter sp. NPDC049651]|uniref:acyl-CoA dehydrogenase family protein n=1 Tax=unclassified Modestobacter TaxID=2643866 RepID=UPI0033C2AEBE
MTEVTGRVAATAAEVDAGTADTRAVLAELGADGLLGRPATADPDVALGSAVALVREVSAASLAAGFSLWSQTMVLEYLRCCPTPGGAPLAEALAGGTVTGATALAPALTDLAGGAPVPVTARRDGAGWRLSGTVPWASNLFDDAVVVTPARTGGGRLVAVFRLSAATRQPAGELLALNGTGTGAVELDDVPVVAVLSEDLAAFVGLCLPAMLLTQSALALGVADAALDSAAGALTGPNALLVPDAEELAARQEDVGDRLTALAATPAEAQRRQLARLRLDALALAGDAVRLEVTVRLGGGFRAGSPTARRVREAAFLPVQAPTVGQLRAQAG